MVLTADERHRYHTDGFVLVPEAIDRDTIDRAIAALPAEFPSPDDFFADPDAHADLHGPFAGNRHFPWSHIDLNLLTAAPWLTAVAEELLESADISIYKAELWAKYAGFGPYDQGHHRDFGNHTLVVPRADGRWRQLTTFVYLNDVGEGDGPTALVPRSETADIPLGERKAPSGELVDREVTVAGPAGSVLLYQTDVFHRGTELTGERSFRFAALIDFKRNDMTWGGKHAWPDHGNSEHLAEFLTVIDARRRSLFGFPPPGHGYWNDQTLADVQIRYPDMDLDPYRT